MPRMDVSYALLRCVVARLLFAFLLPFVVGCMTTKSCQVCRTAALPEVRPGVSGIVFVAGGSGVDRTTTNLTQAVAQSCSPLQVQPVDWQHGRGRYLLDHLDHGN